MSDNVERNVVDLIFDENVDDNIDENDNNDIGNVHQSYFDDMFFYESEAYEHEELDLDKEFAEQEKEKIDVQEVEDGHQQTSSDQEQIAKNGQLSLDGANDVDSSVNDASDNNTDTQSDAAASGAYGNQYQQTTYLVGPNGGGYYAPPGTFSTAAEEEAFIQSGSLARADASGAPMNAFLASNFDFVKHNPGVQYRQGQVGIFPNEAQPNQSNTPSVVGTAIQPDIPLPRDNSNVEIANQMLDFLQTGGSVNDANLNDAGSNINSATDPQSGVANSSATDPQSSAVNHQSSMANPQSDIANSSATDPQSSMAIPQSGIANYQSSAVNPRSSVANQPNVPVSESAGNEHADGKVSDEVHENEQEEEERDDENDYELGGEWTQTAPEPESDSEPEPEPEPRQLVEHIMDPVTHGADMNTRFSSLQEARAWRRYTFRKPEDDPTIPTTEEQMRAIVVELSNAMKAIGHSTDNKPFRKRYKNRLIAEKVEVAAWETLDLLIRRCRDGPLAQSQENANFEKKRPPQLPFQERLQQVLDALYKRKTICKRLMDFPTSHNLVDHPIREMNRSEANQKLNVRKADMVQAGKEVLKAQEAQKNETQANNAEGGDAIPAPSNKARRGRGKGQGNVRAAPVKNAARGRGNNARAAPMNNAVRGRGNDQPAPTNAHNAPNVHGLALPAPLNTTLGGHAVPAPPSSLAVPPQPQPGASATAPTAAAPSPRRPASTRGGRRAATPRQRTPAANVAQNYLPDPLPRAQRAAFNATAPQVPKIIPQTNRAARFLPNNQWPSPAVLQQLQTPMVNAQTNGYVPLPTQHQNQYGVQQRYAMPTYPQKNAGPAQNMGFLMTNAAAYLEGDDNLSYPTEKNYSMPAEVPPQPVAQPMQQSYPQANVNQNQMPGTVYGQQANQFVPQTQNLNPQVNQFVPQTPRRNRQTNMSQNAMAGQTYDPQFNPSASPNKNRRMSGQATQYNPQVNMNQNHMVYNQQVNQQQNQSVRQNQSRPMPAQAFQPQVNQMQNHPMTGPAPRPQPASGSGNATSRKRSQAEMGPAAEGMVPPPPKRAHH